MNLQENIQRIKEVMSLQENKQKYEYSCAMLYFLGEGMKELHNNIDPDDLYIEGDGFGLEVEPHCTLLYGLHDNEVDFDQVRNVVGSVPYGKCRAHNLSLFENPKFDVLKYDIEGDNLYDVNNELKKFPFTSDYPDYHPHLTVAYLKPGKGKYYVSKFGNMYKEFEMTPKHVIYSRPDGSKNEIPISLK